MDSVDIEGTFAWTESSIITFGLDRQKKTRQEEDMALLALLLLLMQQSISASIYPVASELWIPAYQKTEKMFATDQGPVFARTGNSSITFDVDGVDVPAKMDGWRLVVFCYHVANFETFESVEDKIELLACSQEAGLKFDGMENVEKYSFTVQNQSVHAQAVYPVTTSGWVDSQIFVCSTDESDDVMSFKGTMEIRNPYGYLPAVLYGMLPFSGMLTIAYGLLDIFFASLLVRHRKQLLGLHYGILAVVSIGTVATAVWFYAFYRMNETGEPVCCPYPKPFLAAVVLDAIVRTLARMLLLVVCLGYGIVRDNLRRSEVVIVALLSLAYFVSGIGDEITRGTSSGAEFRQKPTVWSFVQLFCNLAFIMWIHYSMETILKELREQKQFAKHGMYKSLAWALGGFIVFFTLLTAVTVCSRFGVFETDVEWEWMQLVAWPVLNFIVSASMCYIWRPTENSSQYAFSMQLPMTDDGNSLEMTATSRDSSDDDLDDSDDEEIDMERSPPKDAAKGKHVDHDDAEDEV